MGLSDYRTCNQSCDQLPLSDLFEKLCPQCVLNLLQTGFIQIGQDSLFIKPVDETDPSQSFSGLKHRLQRQRRSAEASPAPDPQTQSSYYGTAGEPLHLPLHYLCLYFIKTKQKKGERVQLISILTTDMITTEEVP